MFVACHSQASVLVPRGMAMLRCAPHTPCSNAVLTRRAHTRHPRALQRVAIPTSVCVACGVGYATGSVRAGHVSVGSYATVCVRASPRSRRLFCTATSSRPRVDLSAPVDDTDDSEVPAANPRADAASVHAGSEVPSPQTAAASVHASSEVPSAGMHADADDVESEAVAQVSDFEEVSDTADELAGAVDTLTEALGRYSSQGDTPTDDTEVDEKLVGDIVPNDMVSSTVEELLDRSDSDSAPLTDDMPDSAVSGSAGPVADEYKAWDLLAEARTSTRRPRLRHRGQNRHSLQAEWFAAASMPGDTRQKSRKRAGDPLDLAISRLEQTQTDQPMGESNRLVEFLPSLLRRSEPPPPALQRLIEQEEERKRRKQQIDIEDPNPPFLEQFTPREDKVKNRALRRYLTQQAKSRSHTDAINLTYVTNAGGVSATIEAATDVALRLQPNIRLSAMRNEALQEAMEALGISQPVIGKLHEALQYDKRLDVMHWMKADEKLVKWVQECLTSGTHTADYLCNMLDVDMHVLHELLIQDGPTARAAQYHEDLELASVRHANELRLLDATATKRTAQLVKEMKWLSHRHFEEQRHEITGLYEDVLADNSLMALHRMMKGYVVPSVAYEKSKHKTFLDFVQLLTQWVPPDRFSISVDPLEPSITFFTPLFLHGYEIQWIDVQPEPVFPRVSPSDTITRLQVRVDDLTERLGAGMIIWSHGYVASIEDACPTALHTTHWENRCEPLQPWRAQPDFATEAHVTKLLGIKPVSAKERKANEKRWQRWCKKQEAR